MKAQPTGRVCPQCDMPIARDNKGPLCTACQKKSSNALFGAPEVPHWFWDTTQMREALRTRHMGKVVQAFRRHPYHGRTISQSVAAGWLHLTQSQLSRIESGPSVQDLDRLIHWAHILRIPSALLWFASPDQGTSRDGSNISAPPPPEDDEWYRMSELLRRTFLKRSSLAAVTLPAIGLEELKHIVAALNDARRYADREVVGYFERQLADCAAKDRMCGPKESIPLTLGLLAAIEQMAVQAKSDVRQELLRVGARTAEFAGWLYRDVVQPELAMYWLDRAVEWAQAASDFPMQGYVLLKKSQTAWDNRDGLRMLTLAEAVQDGPWHLPADVQAEAAQQVARGHAMLGADANTVEPHIGRARDLLDQSSGEAPSLSPHYDEALFEIQVALTFAFSGFLEKALAVYEQWLSPEIFARRDYGYLLAFKAMTIAEIGNPDGAAATGVDALTIATETNSARTHSALIRLAGDLRPHWQRPAVRELRDALLA